MRVAMTAMYLMTGVLTAECASRTIRDHAERDTRPVETRIYKQVDGQDLRLLVCKPDGWQAGQKRAAMVWIHGGGWVGGAPEAFLPQMNYSAARGAVAFGIQYRLMTSGGYKDDKKLSDEENEKRRVEKRKGFFEGASLGDLVADCQDAMRYIRANSDALGVDPERITAIGDSAGAHLAACLGTVAEGDARANAVIACSSISDLTTGFGPDYIKPSAGFDGKELEEDPERLARAKKLSPFFNITDNGTAFLILAGRNDWLKDEPDRFYKALKEKGIDCEFKAYTQGRHAFIVYGYSATDEQITRALLDLDDFLVRRGLLDGPHYLAMPKDASCIPEPPVAPPDGKKGLAFDNHGNFWTCVSGALYVLPAQDQTAWIKDELSNLPTGRWRSVTAADSGHIQISDGKRTLRMNPHKPEAGWSEAIGDDDSPIPAWRKNWQLVARMPSGTHDLSGDVLNGKFYMDWAITGDFGYPSTGAFHRKLLEFDPATANWRIVADYGLPRGYCAVGSLADQIWTVSGAAKNPEGERYNPTLTQIFDPATALLRKGPDLPVAIPAAIGLSAGKRLYVLGFPEGKDTALKLFSIGSGETAWAAEPDGPLGGGSSYGCELNGKLYTVVAHKCIAIFDTKTKTWETIEAPHSPRSPAISHYRGEIWIMGGRTKEGGEVTYIYNPETKQWRKGTGLPCELVWGCAFNIDGELYLTGGASTSPYTFNNRTFKFRESKP